uniref:Mitochondrial carrier protein n=1 Tax=Kalanchoe fedtschenkoi TaxID=63787 RepID=A0A7N0VB95_KALFE
MSLGAAQEESAAEIRLPADIDWEMLDKSRFFILGAALFSGVSGALYPMVVLKTRQQVQSAHLSSLNMSMSIMRHEGVRGFYRGFGTSLMGTIPARALYMGALEVTKSAIGSATCEMGFSDATSLAVANAAGGLTSAMAAQFVWTPIDVISQRLMVQTPGKNLMASKINQVKYSGGIDAFQKIVRQDGVRGLYRGFGVSILTYAPSNAVWWASYSTAHRLIWGSVSSADESSNLKSLAVQAASAAMASGVSALITTPLDTIKTRMQVLDGCGSRSIAGTVKDLVSEGGLRACYRGLGPRWASMSMSATTMITTYEFVKRLSAKSPDSSNWGC